MVETLNIMVTKGQLSEEDEEKIWDELIKIFEEYEFKNIHAIYEHVNTSTISLIRRAKKLSKESKKNKSNLMMSRKGFKK